MSITQLFLEFFRRKTPKPTREGTLYYRQALNLSERAMAFYFLLTAALIWALTGLLHWQAAAMAAAMVLKLWFFERRRVRRVRHSEPSPEEGGVSPDSPNYPGSPDSPDSPNSPGSDPAANGLSYGSAAAGALTEEAPRLRLLIQALIIWLWCWWYIHCFGWSSGGQHILILVVMLSFFSVYEQPAFKLLYLAGTLAERLLLFSYAMGRAPAFPFRDTQAVVLQTVNTVMLFVTFAACCVVYSCNLLESERELLLHNEQLQHEAETDPLTKLSNRRAMRAQVELYRRMNPRENWSLAIADIDHFKRINDSYGHPCGDYVLVTLSELFRHSCEGRALAARWGGEEFFFFVPDMNLDEAGSVMGEICSEVRRTEFVYEGIRFSITLTAGVEENDYVSDMDTLLDSADRKLYLGKNSGRDRVVL